MNAFRYVLALIFAMIVPPGILLWLVIHPFVGFWRKVGPFGTYLLEYVAAGAGAVGIYAMRRTLLTVEYGTRWPLLVLGLGALASTIWLRRKLHRHFSNQQLMGLPELAPDRYPQRLVTEGLHAHVRHPRYLQFFLTATGLTLIANYLAPYVILALLVPAIWLVVVLEERELRKRFGPAYAEYSRRVPRFIPRWRRGA